MRPQRRRSFITGLELDIDRGGVLTLTMPPQGCGVPATIVVCCSGSGHPGRPSPGPNSSTTTASPARSVRPAADTVTAGENRTVTVLGSRISTGALVWPGSPGTIHRHPVPGSPASVPNSLRPTGVEASEPARPHPATSTVPTTHRASVRETDRCGDRGQRGHGTRVVSTVSSSKNREHL